MAAIPGPTAPNREEATACLNFAVALMDSDPALESNPSMIATLLFLARCAVLLPPAPTPQTPEK